MRYINSTWGTFSIYVPHIYKTWCLTSTETTRLIRKQMTYHIHMLRKRYILWVPLYISYTYGMYVNIRYINSTRGISEAVPLVGFMYLVFTCMPDESYHRQLWSWSLCLCDVVQELINSLICWFTTHLGWFSTHTLTHHTTHAPHYTLIKVSSSHALLLKYLVAFSCSSDTKSTKS